MRDLESLAKENNLRTVCDVVELFSKALKETNVRDPVSLPKKKNLSTDFYVDSVLLHNDITVETITYIYIHAKMGCTRKKSNAKQSTKKHWYTSITFVKKRYCSYTKHVALVSPF